MTNLVWQYLVLLTFNFCHFWPFWAGSGRFWLVFRYLPSPYRQRSFDVQLSMALKTFNFWTFWPILANRGHFRLFFFKYLNSLPKYGHFG